MKDSPYFSIIIPTYNRAELIPRTIVSVLNQSFKDYEIIVVDDGSSDETEEKLREYTGKGLISYYKKKNEERAKARNYGAERAKGKYLYFLDSDDLLYPLHLEKAREFIGEKSPEIFFQQYEFVEANQNTKPNYSPKGKTLNAELIYKGNFMSCHGVFILAEVFKLNQFAEDRSLSGSEDYELWLRMAARYPIYYSAEITSALVLHSQRSVLNFDSKALIVRKEKMLELLRKDQIFQKKYGMHFKTIEANAFSYISLHLALINENKLSFRYLKKSLKSKPSFIFEKRFWAIVKHLVKK